MNKNLLNKIGFILSMLFFVISVIILHKEMRGYHYQDIIDSIRMTSHIRLYLAGVFTILSFYVMTLYEVYAFRSINHPLKFKKVGFTSFIANAFSHIMGFAVVTGSLIRFRQYTAWGLSALEIGNTMIIRTISFWMGFCLVCGVLFVSEYKEIAAIPYLHFHSTLFIGIGCLVIIAGYLVWNKYNRTITIKNKTIQLPAPHFSLMQIMLSAIDWIFLALVLYVLMPASVTLSYPRFFTIFFAAQVGAFISNVPGGLGVFELIIIHLFSSQVPASHLMGSLILYRFVYYLFPMGIAMCMMGIYEAAVLKGFAKRATAYIGDWVPGLISPVFSVTIFITGAILIFSGATPTLAWRLAFLKKFIPLPLMELSHFTGSIAGIGLMILGRGLYYRLNGSYILSLILLGAGIVVSLCKGFDYEEAIFLSIILIAMIPCYKFFYRKSSFLDEKFTFGWVAAISIVILSSLGLGIFSYNQVQYSHALWGYFSFTADASRFLRSSAGVMGFAFVFGLIKLLRPVSYKPRLPDEDELIKASEIALRSPYTYAQLALLGDKELIFNNKGTAFIMFGIKGKSWIAMGEPVGQELEIDELLWKFIEDCDLYNAWPVFYEISEKNIHYYTDVGLTCIKIGEEAVVTLETLNLQETTHKELRYIVHRLEKEGYIFEIINLKENNNVLYKLQHVSDAWLNEKKTLEKRFSSGIFNKEYLARSPVGIVKKDEKIFAFSTILLSAEKQELSVDFMRHLPHAPHGIMDYLFIKLMRWGREQGYQCFNAGMAPLSGVDHNPLGKLGTFVFKHGEHFCNFQGLRKFKEQFMPVWQSKYLAYPGDFALPHIFANLAALISGSGGRS